jgi:hypothetical protein
LSALPDSGWKGYGSPQHPLTPRARKYPNGNLLAVMADEMHAEIAEYRLSHDGIKPELLAYLHGIGESVK